MWPKLISVTDESEKSYTSATRLRERTRDVVSFTLTCFSCLYKPSSEVSPASDSCSIFPRHGPSDKPDRSLRLTRLEECITDMGQEERSFVTIDGTS